MEFNNYFNGQYIEATDLNFDNESHRNELAQRFNVVIDVPGIADGYKDGLRVIPGALPDSITILSGVAFDFNGKVIEVLEEDENRINIPFANTVGVTYYVKAKYKQLFTNPEYDPETGIGPDPDNPEIPYFTKVQDYYEIDISPTEPDLLEVELGRVIGVGTGNIVPSNLIDISKRRTASIKNSFLTNIDHKTLQNIGSLTHDQIDQRFKQLFEDLGLVPTADGSPSLSLPMLELIGNIFDHNHSGEGQGARIDHNSLINIHPDQHHKKIHRHSLDPGEADPDSDDAFVEKINLSEDTTEPIEVRGKLSGNYIKNETLKDIHVALDADIDQTKVDNSDIYEDNFAGTPENLEQDLNQLRTEIKRIKFGNDPTKRFNDPVSGNIEDISEATTDKFDNPNGHKHTGVDGDGPQLNHLSIASKSLIKSNIADETIDNDLIAINASIKESKLDLEPSYAFRNFAISGAGIASFIGGALNLVEPLIIYDVNCDKKVEAITNGPLDLLPGDVIYVVWPENHDNNNQLEIQSSNGSQVIITDRTIVLGYVNEDDERLYVKWGHNPFHRHTGAPGDGQQLDINLSTTGILDESRIDPDIARKNYVDTSVTAHNMSDTAHPDIRALIDPLTTPYVKKAGDTMTGNLTFENNKRLVFKKSSNDSIHFVRPDISPSSEATLQLILGKQGSSTTTNPKFEIGQTNGGNFDSQIVLHGDSGNIETEGNVTSSARITANNFLATTGTIYGTGARRMTQTTSDQIILNPVGDFIDGVKVRNNLYVDGNGSKLFIENQILKESNDRAVFSKLVAGDELPTVVEALDFLATSLDGTTTVGGFITQLLNRSFHKEVFVSDGTDTITLAQVPAANSVTVFIEQTIAHEGVSHNYTVSGDQIIFNAGSVPVNGDNIFVQYYTI